MRELIDYHRRTADILYQPPDGDPERKDEIFYNPLMSAGELDGLVEKARLVFQILTIVGERPGDSDRLVMVREAADSFALGLTRLDYLVAEDRSIRLRRELKEKEKAARESLREIVEARAALEAEDS